MKSLGVVALGAALTAAGAGAASAAAVTDTVGKTAGKVATTLPALDEAAGSLPRDTGDVVGTGKDLLSGKSDTLPALTDTLSHTRDASSVSELTEPALDLLGGMPVDPTEQLGLPTGQVLDGVKLAM
ncbi:ATP-binding protein [Streptomyces marincola]|uniref:ATP-binding protein n=1 Tax=Streptomyces marincola TaxID=2878388 RepID=UPI001CF0DF98|nr:ATP-binding protein [Streptomyces marincola]UCM90002.1 ATP-binding protein [Streptomyces marincola]